AQPERAEGCHPSKTEATKAIRAALRFPRLFFPLARTAAKRYIGKSFFPRTPSVCMRLLARWLARSLGRSAMADTTPDDRDPSTIGFPRSQAADLNTTLSEAPIPPVPLPPGTASRYRTLELHARGGLGEVFLARDEELQRDVALKSLQSNRAGETESRRRFL